MTPLDEAAWFDERVAMILQDTVEPTSQEITKANLEAMKQLRAFKASGHAWVKATQENTGKPEKECHAKAPSDDIPWSPK